MRKHGMIYMLALMTAMGCFIAGPGAAFAQPEPADPPPAPVESPPVEDLDAEPAPQPVDRADAKFVTVLSCVAYFLPSTVDIERVVRMDLAEEELTIVYDGLRVVSGDGLYVRTDPVERAGTLPVCEIVDDRRMMKRKPGCDLLHTIRG